MVLWPTANVPFRVSPETWTETPQSNISIFETEVGPPQQRRRASASGYRSAARLTLTDAQLASFWEWFEDTAKDGSLPFTLAHPITGTVYDWVLEGAPEATQHGRGAQHLTLRLLRLPVAFTPAIFFAGGEQGALFDFTKASGLFTDSAGTTPVTANNDPIGRVNDGSGQNNHATQATAGSRMLWKSAGYAQADGVDDFLVTGNINFSATDKITMLLGHDVGSTNVSVPLELSAESSLNNGSFGYLLNNAVAGQVNWQLRGTAASGFLSTSTTVAAVGNKIVTSAKFDIAGAARATEIYPRLNGALPELTASGAANAGTGNFGAAYPLYIGRRGGTALPFNGKIYYVLVVGRALTATEIAKGELYIAGKMGVALP